MVQVGEQELDPLQSAAAVRGHTARIAQGDADEVFHRARVYDEGVWRLSVVRGGPVAGFAHLEPHRHIPHTTDLDGSEATAFGSVLARVSAALRAAPGANPTYAYVFGEQVPTCTSIHLAPHLEGDALVGGPGLVRADAVELPAERHGQVAAVLRELLAVRA